MVRNKLHWDANDAWDFKNKGKSGWTGKSSFVLEVPLRHLRPSVIYSVPCDRILQRAYWVPITSFFYFLIRFYISPYELLRKKFSIWIILTVFKNVQICCHFGPPFQKIFPWFVMSCDVDSGPRDIWLDSSGLFYLMISKFSLVVHTLKAGKSTL